MTSTSSPSASVPTCSGRRIPPAHANRFDGEVMSMNHQHAAATTQSTASVNTSISSVSTEPHAAEPTPRRRVQSPPAPIFDVMKAAPNTPPHNRSAGSLAPSPTTARVASLGTSPINTTTGSPVRKNNPYMYNVLGEHASPDFASRTSPLPPTHDIMNHTAASSITTSPTFAGNPLPVPSSGRRGSANIDWDDVQQLQQAETLGSPVLGSYMAQCYSSAFPPGHLPKPMTQQDMPKSGAKSACPQRGEPGTGRRRGRRGGSNSPHNSSTATIATATTVASPPPLPAAVAPATGAPPVVVAAPQQQPRPVAASSPSPDDDGAAMTRVYRNGRPVPVPTAASCVK